MENILKLNIPQMKYDSTLKERERMLNIGWIEVTPAELDAMLADLGYKISKTDSFNYYNSHNEIHYNAKSCYIVDIKTKMSFAHVDFYPKHPERHEKLQKLRNDYFAFDTKKGIIYEL
jgi:hypothetical protein